MGKLLTPGQTQVGLQEVGGTAAFPSSMVLNAPGQIIQRVHGGFTKLEHGALTIAAAMVGPAIEQAILSAAVGEDWNETSTAERLAKAEAWILEYAPKLAVAAAFKVLCQAEAVQAQMEAAAHSPQLET